MKTILAMSILVSVAITALADAVDDPWALVPALPTACYAQDDDFPNQANAALTALHEAAARQAEINGTISEQYRNMDPMELQQRMVEFMMANPAEAQQAMMAMQQTGQQASEGVAEMSDRHAALNTEFDELMARYKQAVAQSMAPIEAKGRQLASASGGCTQATLASAAALEKEKNQAYEALCTDWWMEGGAMHLWLAEFKQRQIEWAAREEELAAAATFNYEMAGISTDQYRETKQIDAAATYLTTANQVFQARKSYPLSEVPMARCSDHG